MNLINAISNHKLRCSKVQIQIKLPWESSYIFYVCFWTVRFNRLQYETYKLWKALFFQPTHLKLMCKQDNSQALLFCMLRRPPTRLCLQFSYNWTTVVQNELNFPSCSLVWSLRVLVTGFLQWWVGWYAAAAAHAQWANVGNLLMKRTTAFKGTLRRKCQLLFVNTTFKLGPSSPAQRHPKRTACMYAAR